MTILLAIAAGYALGRLHARASRRWSINDIERRKDERMWPLFNELDGRLP